ncbi:serine hydrolase [Paenibacillus faecis]|uniref:Serine hydrolase n=1 Tax=Paenibacillus faecis TaxID=862114 RepID=A0A5D0CS62_9BACL|nr:serine hydrolase [Paenibacillus faecis]TYA11627.1 serine hydrolase [Paenibacillus faecis]
MLKQSADPSRWTPIDQNVRRAYPKIRSLLVWQSGTPRFEAYYNGYDASHLHDLRSATKSVLSLLLGIAHRRGELPGLDQPVWDDVKDHAPARPDPAWSELTLHELLSMTSGLYWQTGPKLGERYIHRFHRSRNWRNFILRLPVVPERRGAFMYCSPCSHLLSVLLSKWTGCTALDYASRHLFQPLNIAGVRWEASPEGYSGGHVGLHMTAEHMLKIGILCLQKGKWEGRALVSPEWIGLACSPQCPPFHTYGRYGYHWWNDESSGIRYSYAHGHGGQQIYVIPDLEAVVASASDSKVRRYKNPKVLLEHHILPALQSTSLRGEGP